MKRWLKWTLVALALLVLLSALSLWSWGQFASRARGAPSSALPPLPQATALDRAVAPRLIAHAGQSGGALVTDNVQAFALRAQSAREAGRSLDAMYYIWRGDLTGSLLKHELLAAAERGVRVRLLIDDMNGPARDRVLLALDAHPNLEVRLFNPARNRATAWGRALEMALRFVGFNRRMHNKAWIADNRVAIVGGRNLGDEYFDAAEHTNFQDADLLLLGPAVAQASAIFDQFWNSAAVIPLATLKASAAPPTAAELADWRQALHADARASAWVRALGDPERLADKLASGLTLHWSESLRVLSDPPEKAAPVARRQARPAWLLYDVMALLFSAERQSWLISPYFVPGAGGTLLLSSQATRGVDVRVLTNSLVANDVPVVHAGYMNWREPLLAQGVQLYELKPGAVGAEREWLGGSSGASLHTKAFVVDGTRGFVGSFNFDPRSAQLNTEMGVVFDHPALAAELQRLFERGADPASAWRVTLHDGALRWHGTGEPTWTHEPASSAGLRTLVWLLGWLPIESQL